MTFTPLRFVFLALVLALFVPIDSALAQSCDDNPDGDACGEIQQPPPPPPPESEIDLGPVGQSLNTGVTNDIVKILKGANATCDREIEWRYRIDCLRIYYLKVAERLPNTGDYLPIKKAMLEASAKLDLIITANLDEGAPALRPREGHKPAAKRLPPLRAVKKGKTGIALAQAAKVVKETELIILRSGGDPARRTQHYTEVAAAVEDNLIILRSA